MVNPIIRLAAKLYALAEGKKNNTIRNKSSYRADSSDFTLVASPTLKKIGMKELF
jgi:hypothetical protein